MSRPRQIVLVVGCVLLVSASIAPVSGASNETTTATPAGNQTTTTTSQDSGSNLTKDKIIQWAKQDRDIHKTRAEELMRWFNSNTGKFSVSETKLVRDWLTSELTTGQSWDVDTVISYAKQGKDVTLSEAESIYDWYLGGGNTDLTKKQRDIVSGWLKTQLSQSDGTKTPATATPTNTNNTTAKNPSDYRTAKKAVKDDHVAEGELGSGWRMKNKEIGPVKVIAVEGAGETSTFIIKSSTPTMASFTDIMAVSHGSGAARVPSKTLHSGYNVVQIKTTEYNGKEEVWIAAGGYVDDIKFKQKADIVPEPYRWYDVFLGFLLSVPLLVGATLMLFRRRKNKPKSPGVAD